MDHCRGLSWQDAANCVADVWTSLTSVVFYPSIVRLSQSLATQTYLHISARRCVGSSGCRGVERCLSSCGHRYRVSSASVRPSVRSARLTNWQFKRSLKLQRHQSSSQLYVYCFSATLADCSAPSDVLTMCRLTKTRDHSACCMAHALRLMSHVLSSFTATYVTVQLRVKLVRKKNYKVPKK